MGQRYRYGFIGGGNMGEALIKGLIASGTAKPEEICFHDPDPGRQDRMRRDYQSALVENAAESVKSAPVVILAVKPQVMDNVLKEIAAAVTADHLIISVAAGITLARLEAAWPAPVPVIRVMPNTPALVLAGAAALSPGSFATPEHMKTARSLFEAVGVAVELEEKYMDVVTGLSGGGPAYIFVLLEALTDGAVRLGLPRPRARLLAAQTIMGAAKMALETGLHPAELKDQVVSPGGTTAAGLHVLEKGGFRGLIMEAVAAATARAGELGSK
ncbi:MAG: pyrroline-5-carboxylate reductase [Thermodesulfobacteriota bacterium]